ncbi:DUF2798 domain-containing protein [Devosia sp.]|jgi:hypothetical protein|uniref:DUF2798 domain-containing protein n=1 Tax=Devosia sp. TaxID=1871048 RepID=UPI0037C099D3
MQSWKTRVLGQVLMTFCMALIMSGAMGFIALGPAFLPHWLPSFLTAWPIAFVVSQVVSPVAFKLAFKLTQPAPRTQP